MIETLLYYSEESLKSQFKSSLFYEDTVGATDCIVTVDGPNTGID